MHGLELREKFRNAIPCHLTTGDIHLGEGFSRFLGIIPDGHKGINRRSLPDQWSWCHIKWRDDVIMYGCDSTLRCRSNPLADGSD
jgi:hypothetical protein